YYDLDWIVTTPNMDPHIKPFETLRETNEEVVVRTGFGGVVRKRFDLPMPEAVSWETDTIEKLEAFEFDPPDDPRRFFEGGDNQIAGVGDGFARNSPPWLDTVKSLRKDYALYGSMIETSECLTRMIGQMNTLMWVGEYPERLGQQILRIGDFYYQCCKAEIEAAEGLLDGMVIWGDVAYSANMFFAPEYWRTYFRPGVEKMIALCHRHSLPVIYHGCGNVKAILPDFIEMKLDAYNPLEAKAGLDVVALRRQYGHSIAFCGNGNIQVWEAGQEEALRREVLRKLNAAKGGGFIFQSDHSVSSGVSGHTYDFIVNLVREFGQYPLELGEYDEQM
ncbi:MAG TPA: uroporphyrinogen decarboxylase family protein, partial [Candidatus Hydrogenedentes bacterium]|nr:uroporphyrinogen decarboxylase family protein [Candidatus Hydrogenedentota bacterium]